MSKTPDLQNEILQDLDSKQKSAVTSGHGPLLIVAGAGTGKTTVITRRLAYLIEKEKLTTANVLALTFTEKAAEEMEERMDILLPLGYGDLWIHTFHGFCDRILRDNAIDIGLDPNFKVLTQANSWLFIRQNLFKFKLDYYRPLGSPTKFITELAKHFGRAKDENISPEDYLKYADMASNKKIDKEEKKRIKEIASAYKVYQDLMAKNNYLDFNDLIIYTLKLFKKRPNILEKYRKQFKYILVDEFQDTNYAQYELIKLLAFPKNNITVCGDDDQSIYKFRGASISNILEFEKDYPKTKKIVLIKNYRSKQNILDTAYYFIQLNNPERLEAKYNINKKIKAVKGKGESPKHIHKATVENEALSVIKEIIDLKKKNPDYTWSDFAILVRANADADIFVNALDRHEIPYQFVASKGLYTEPIIMDLIAYLKVINNFYDSISLYRVLNIPIFRISTKNLIKLFYIARKKNLSLIDVLLNIKETPGISYKTIKSVEKIVALIEKHARLARTKPPGQVLLQFLSDAGYLKDINRHRDSLEYQKKMAHITSFFKRIQEFQETGHTKTVKDFIEELELTMEAGEDPAPGRLEEGPEAVKIMTIHSAKGLEFTNVFIISLVNDRFPIRNKKDLIELPEALIKEKLPKGDIHIQEERRLFYVAMTRAKERLLFTSAEDYGGKRKKRISKFLKEIEPFLKTNTENYKPKSKKEDGFDLAFLKLNRDCSDLNKKAKFVLPKKFSYTQLAVFETCPLQYKFAHIIKIPSQNQHTYSYGKSIHNTLKIFYQIIQKGKTPSLEKLLDLYENNWIDEWYDSKVHEEKRKKDGKKALEKFYEENKNRFKVPLFIEQNFNIKLGNYAFIGAIDRIDSLKGNEVEIIDYKTGNLSLYKEKEILKDKQLTIYALAASQAFNLKPVKLTLYYLDVGRKLSTNRSKIEIERTKEEIIGTIDKIHQSKFLPTPGFHCKYCDFREICEARAK